MTSPAPPIRESEVAIAAVSQSFAAAAKLMPRAIRDDVVMLYAWCRHADDVIDGQALGSAPELVDNPAGRLAALRADTLRALNSDDPMSPAFAALRRVARRHDFPADWPLTLIDGFAMDVEGRSYKTIEDTLDYAYHVAGIVGVMMARVMGVHDPQALDRACDLGIAFQLTNIARDVLDDAAIGRVYLPSEWLTGMPPLTAATAPSPELHAVVLRLLDLAEPYYASAWQGLPALPLRAAWSIASALRIYRQIGIKIRRGGPAVMATRAGTSGSAKLIMAFIGGVDAFRSRASVSRAECGSSLFRRP
ncbi:phytoene/squalene synthase family protein [uncultured Tateyamaria sp.]|uniref:phytoene/squalene synthase family protein n=1 Tax=Rhodobacterales TaxID=204455 RepID=UPI00263682B0|nr:phytoene/squalene synthase family protein [uncultured Tateyamaria sp.]